MMKPSQLMSDLTRGALAPLYLFSGEEGYLVQQALARIVERAVDPNTRDFNFNTLYCRETPVSELVALAETLPFASPWRLIIAKEFDAYKASDAELLLPYLKAPSPHTCLVMVSNERKYDRKAIVSAVEASGGACVVFYPLFENEVQGWMTEWARGRGLTIRPDAAHYVKQTLGTDLQKIANELEKVAIFLKERRTVTLDDVRQVVGEFREYSAFDLVEAIGKKDRERAFVILGRILEEGEQPVGLLGMVAWNFRRLLKAKGMEEAGQAYDVIKKKINVMYFQSSSFQEQLRRFSLEELRRAFRVMLETDRRLKSSSLDGGLVMERMIVELCGA